MCSMPVTAERGIKQSSRKRPASATIRIGLLCNRSTHTPANSPKRSVGSVPKAVNMPICSAVALRTSTAVRGIASKETCEPNRETVCPPHSLRKSGWCQSPVSRNLFTMDSLSTLLDDVSGSMLSFFQAIGKRLRQVVPPVGGVGENRYVGTSLVGVRPPNPRFVVDSCLIALSLFKSYSPPLPAFVMSTLPPLGSICPVSM